MTYFNILRTHQFLVALLIALLVATFSIPACIWAQPSVRIVFIDPDVRGKEVSIGEIPEVKFIAQATPPGAQLAWNHRGPGDFDGATDGLASIYLVPNRILGESERVIITVTATDRNGNTGQDSVTFTIFTAAVSETPDLISLLTQTPTPAAEPPTPALASPQIEQTLKKADEYFQQKRYTKPERENAFELYKDVLREDPTNTHAREKIRQMAELYQGWGDSAYRQGEYPKAASYYQRYLLLAQYMFHTLGDKEVQQDIQEVERRINKLLTPKPTATPAWTPTTVPARTPAVSPELTKLEELERTLSQYLSVYQELKQEETQGLKRNKQLIVAVRQIIQVLVTIENTLEEEHQKSQNTQILQRIQSTRTTRQQYEQELLDRLIAGER